MGSEMCIRDRLYELTQEEECLSFGQQFYKKKVGEVIQEGGDTDTNGAIVGGFLGALVGFKGLPQRYVRKMLELTFGEEEMIDAWKRPKIY